MIDIADFIETAQKNETPMSVGDYALCSIAEQLERIADYMETQQTKMVIDPRVSKIKPPLTGSQASKAPHD